MIPLLASNSLSQTAKVAICFAPCMAFAIIQYTRNALVDFILDQFSQRGLSAAGNALRCPCSRHLQRCSHVCCWLKLIKCGSSPLHSASAKAAANNPQSFPPLWCWKSMNLICISADWHFIIAAIWCVRVMEMDGDILS